MLVSLGLGNEYSNIFRIYMKTEHNSFENAATGNTCLGNFYLFLVAYENRIQTLERKIETEKETVKNSMAEIENCEFNCFFFLVNKFLVL